MVGEAKFLIELAAVILGGVIGGMIGSHLAIWAYELEKRFIEWKAKRYAEQWHKRNYPKN